MNKFIKLVKDIFKVVCKVASCYFYISEVLDVDSIKDTIKDGVDEIREEKIVTETREPQTKEEIKHETDMKIARMEAEIRLAKAEKEKNNRLNEIKKWRWSDSVDWELDF